MVWWISAGLAEGRCEDMSNTWHYYSDWQKELQEKQKCRKRWGLDLDVDEHVCCSGMEKQRPGAVWWFGKRVLVLRPRAATPRLEP